MKVVVFFNGVERAVLTPTHECERLSLPIPAEAGECIVKFAVPLKDIQQYWTPDFEGVCNRLSWSFDVVCGAQRKFPLVCLFNRANINRLAFGLDDLLDDCRIHADVNQAACTYDITITLACCAETAPVRLLLDSRPISWMDALADARRELLPEMPPAFPEAAWNPVFCTWYAVHGAVDAAWVEKTAPLACGLGFTTLIVDDGWCYPEYKRLSPETLKVWYRDIGDWNIAQEKFPNMPAHVDKIHKFGMKYLVWTTPMLWGQRSDVLREHPDAITAAPPADGCVQFDVHHEEIGRECAEKLGRLVAENHLDGLKVDFIDLVENDPAHPNGRASFRLVQSISEAINRATPGALVEFRQNYATPAMLPFATQFRAGDAPFDYILNFERCVQIRLCLGDCVPVHADPAYWADDELSENISRHLIAMMVGTPMLSMELSQFPQETLDIIKHWTSFYNAHRAVLNLGHWRFGFSDGVCTWALAGNDMESVIILRDAQRLQESVDAAASAGGKTVWILNLSPDAVQVQGAQTFGPSGTPAQEGIIPLGGYAREERFGNCIKQGGFNV